MAKQQTTSTPPKPDLGAVPLSPKETNDSAPALTLLARAQAAAKAAREQLKAAKDAAKAAKKALRGPVGPVGPILEVGTKVSGAKAGIGEIREVFYRVKVSLPSAIIGEKAEIKMVNLSARRAVAVEAPVPVSA